jgi:hypothetical protein
LAQRKTLNDTQIAVLRWIADDRPDGVMDGVSHRVSAAALRSRGLVRTSGRGSTWTAVITIAGKEYLERLEGVGCTNSITPRFRIREALLEGGRAVEF